MSNLNHLLPPNNPAPNETQLLQYLADNLSNEERHALETAMQNDAFVNDAVEGLQDFANSQQLQQYVADLNKQLQKQTNAKKQRKAKRKLTSNTWALVAIGLVLLLCVLGYCIIHLQVNRHL